MFFIIKNNMHVSLDQLRNIVLVDAYNIIKDYPMYATDMLMDNYIKQQYGVSLRDMCIKLLLNLTFHKDGTENLVLMFRDKKYDAIANLISYGNGAIPGSKILKTAFSN